MSCRIGYARVSTKDQNLNSQVDALKEAGCDKIYHDKISGKEYKREGLSSCLEYLRPGDTLVIYRLDRLGRSVKETLELCDQFNKREIKLVSLQDNLDKSTAVGRFTLQILASLAEYNRNLIVEGCQAGIEAAKKRGVKFGRREGTKLSKPKSSSMEYRFLEIQKASTSLLSLLKEPTMRNDWPIASLCMGELETALFQT